MTVGRDSSVSIATRCGLDCLGSNPSGGEIFYTRPDWPWGMALTPPPSSAEVKERVELFLYSPSGPSWPILG